MASREVVVHVVAGEPRTGLWCPVCALPSRAEIGVWMLTARGLSPLGTRSWCTDHDERGGVDVLD
jgi:hypothetical protein